MSQSSEAEQAASSGRTGVLVMGSLNMDLSVTVSALPRPGETVLAESITRQPGGKGANQAVAAARLGGDVQMIGRLGDDDLARRIRAVLHEAGVDTRHVRTADAATGQAFVTVDARGENVIVVSSGANGQITPSAIDLDADVLRSARIAVTQLETPLDSVERFARHCTDFGVDLLLNAAPYREITPDLLGRCRYLVLNQDEASSLTGVDVADRGSAVQALVAARRLGADTVVITLGGDGCMAVHGPQLFELDAFDVPVVDTTGAGDAFVGAFAVALAEGLDFAEALRFAAAAGATACAHAGAQSLTSPDETRQLLREQGRIPRQHLLAAIDRFTPALHR